MATNTDGVHVLPEDEHNQRLVRNVHPADWKNPQPGGRYNLVVVGAGTAGLVTAAGAAGLGAKVALVERELMGGDCLNVGCVPSKALIRSARSVAEVRKANQFGVKAPSAVHADFPAIMRRMRRLRSGISPNDSAARFRSLGVDVYLGQGKFTSKDTLDVHGQKLRFARAVIATGARALRPAIDGLEEVGYLTNETVFSLTQLPRRLAVIGAGPIGCELAQAFARFGSEVVLIANHDQILPKEDPDAAKIVQRALVLDGIKIIYNCRPLRARAELGEKIISLEGGDCAEVRVDEILVGAGRAPNVVGLGLESAGVNYDDRHGVTVDDHLRTSNSRVYAAGDICSPLKFTHAADAMARIVLQNALFFGRAKVSALTVPWCTYTDPEIAHVGLYEHEAEERKIKVETFTQSLDEVDRAILDGESEGFVRILVRKGSDKIVGATIVAAHAGEMISELTLAMVGNLGLGTLAKTIHPYPTQAEAIKKCADAYNRTRLTPTVKRLFRKLLAWRR